MACFKEDLPEASMLLDAKKEHPDDVDKCLTRAIDIGGMLADKYKSEAENSANKCYEKLNYDKC